MKRAVLIVAAAALCVAGSAMAEDRSGGLIGSGTRTQAVGQTMGSGGFTMTSQSQVMGSGGRTADDGQTLDSGGFLGSGTLADSGQIIGSGSLESSPNGGFLGSGLSVLQLRLRDGLSLLVVSSEKGTFVIPIEQ